MNKIYKTDKIYLVHIALVTKVDPSGWFTNGTTYSTNMPEVYFAKLIKSEDKLIRKINTFKILSRNMVIKDDHNKTSVGDYYITYKQPLSMLIEECPTFVSHKQLLSIEQTLNENAKMNKGKMNVNEKTDNILINEKEIEK